jgi:ABC-type branched-subunit amino acid transport system ATPase component
LIVQDAELILLDEPLAAVDWRTSEDLLRFIVGWQGDGRTVAEQQRPSQHLGDERNHRGRPRRTWQPRPYLAHLIEPEPL